MVNIPQTSGASQIINPQLTSVFDLGKGSGPNYGWRNKFFESDLSMAQTSRRRPVSSGGVVVIPDGSPGKKVPNGLRALFVAICKGWGLGGNQSDESPRTVLEFAKILFPIYNKVCRIYGVRERNSPEALKQHLDALHNGQVHVVFADIRAYADYIGVPSGILLLISQFIGKEIESPSVAKDQLINILDTLTDKSGIIFSSIGNNRDNPIFVEIIQQDHGGKFVKIDIIKLELLVSQLFPVEGCESFIESAKNLKFSNLMPEGLPIDDEESD